MMIKMLAKCRINKRIIRSVTWSCPRCGRPFLTEAERNLHWMSCGS